MPKAKTNFLTEVLRGASQVFFMENALTGLLFFIAIAYASYVSGNWAVTIGAVIGVVVATITAHLIGGDKPSISSGLFGFNGVLVGAALPTFVALSPQLWVYIVVGSAVSTVVTAAFSSTLTAKWGIPGSTGPFVLTGWLLVASAHAFGGLSVTGEAPKLAAERIAGVAAFPAGRELGEVFFRNIGQVYLLGSWVSGAIILVGIFIASFPAGIAAAAGSAIAILVAVGMGAEPSLVSQGLYGFSPVLTAMAVSVIFLSPSVKVILYATLATVMTVFVQAALNVIVAPAGIRPSPLPMSLPCIFSSPPRSLWRRTRTHQFATIRRRRRTCVPLPG